MKLFFLIIFYLLIFSDVNSQIFKEENSESIIFTTNNNEVSYQKNYHPLITKIPGHYSKSDWLRAIDSVWGQGLSTYIKASIFKTFWNYIDSAYACFHNLNPISWQDVRIKYLPIINQGVSRGRFSGIMSYLFLIMKDAHTIAYDKFVYNTALEPGVPLFYIGGWYDNSHFGAGLTPLPDSSLLVYDVVPQHPLGLVRGDIVLGYDGIPYNNLYKEILEIQMPVTGWQIGSSPVAFTHSILNAAGMNWHLFDTIDIKKYYSGDTVHLPTSLLYKKKMNIICTEQMNIPGVPKPDYSNGKVVSYGKVQGTNIGYIYVWAWENNAYYEFYDAVNSLMNTDGLIIDFRYNRGGNMFLSNGGLRLLFPYPVKTISFAGRKSKYNYFDMKEITSPNDYVIYGQPPGYNRPIAVLTGPGAISSGDQVALRMKYHPTAKFFGKSTSSDFSAPVFRYLYDDWVCRYSSAEAFEIKNPNYYLTHRELPVDYEVWLTPDYVSKDKDNVMEAALEWINNTNSNISNVSVFELSQNFPNPFNSITTIKFSIKKESNVKLIVFDISGKIIKTIVNNVLKPGIHYYSFGNSALSSGVYFYKLITGEYSEIKKMVLAK